MKTEDLKRAVFALAETEAIREKFAVMLGEVFASVDPAAVGDDYAAALQSEACDDAVRLCAAYFRKKAPCPLPELSGVGRYSREEADRAVRGIMNEVNIEWAFPDGRVDFQFDASAVKGPVNHEWVWQLNRHGFWAEMGRAYADTGDEAYARAFCRQFTDWLAFTDIPANWNGPGSCYRTIECGIRLMGSWQITFDAFRRAEAVPDVLLLLMLASMHRQTLHLIAHPTGGNWLMMESNGVYTFSSLFPEWKDAEENRRIAADRLLCELNKQILPDGMHNELSPDYQIVVLNCAVNTERTAQATGHGAELPDSFGALIRKTVRAAMLLSTPALTQPRTNDCYTLLTRRYTGRGLRVFGDHPDAEEYRFFDSARKEGRAPAETSVFLPWAGFCVMRSGWEEDAAYLCFDVGPLGMGHMHEDKLNIILYKGSEELLFDDGGGHYEISPYRTYGLSAYDHNTCLVDGMGQTRREPKQSASPIDAHWITTDAYDYAEGTYDDGFGPAITPVASHTRSVRFCKPGFFCVTDTLCAKDGAGHDYELLFQLDTTAVNAYPAIPGALLSDFRRTYELLMVPLDTDADPGWKTVVGQTEPTLRGMFIGRNDLHNHPAATVSRTLHGEARTFRTLLFPIRRDAVYGDAAPVPGESVPAITENADGTLTVRFEGRTYTFDPLHPERP